MQPIIDHIHITVENLTRAERFYDALLPILGFDLVLKEKDCVPEYEYEIIEYHHKNFSLGIVNQRKEFINEKINRRKAGALHHLAFHAARKEDVDFIFEAVKKLQITIIHKPQYYPEYCKDYYAFFFKDSEGIEYEIVNFERASYFE